MLNFGLSLAPPSFVAHKLFGDPLRKKRGIYDFIRSLIREYIWLLCRVSSFSSSFFFLYSCCSQEFQSLHSHNLGDFEYDIIQPQLF